MKLKLIITISILGLILIANATKADYRKFVWTYEYMIMPKNASELETYTTFETVDQSDAANTTTTKLNLEFEVGMNEHFDFAVYQNFKQSPGKGLSYDGFKLRTRIKIGEQDKYFIDPLIYLEYANTAGFEKHKFEPKLILAKTLGDFGISVNPYLEIEKADSVWEVTPKYAAGVNYNFSRLLSLGFEVKGDKYGHYIGPTIAHGLNDAWFAFGALYKIGDVTTGKPEFQIRLIMGFEI